eukprot:11228940-Ditylum_brightwellii.AAC.1
MNSLQNTQSQVPTTPITTMVTFVPGTQVMPLILAGVSNGENNQSGGNPMICEIMASQTQPRETRCQFQVNAMQRLQISNLEVEGNKELCLIDGGSNN